MKGLSRTLKQQWQQGISAKPHDTAINIRPRLIACRASSEPLTSGASKTRLSFLMRSLSLLFYLARPCADRVATPALMRQAAGERLLCGELGSGLDREEKRKLRKLSFCCFQCGFRISYMDRIFTWLHLSDPADQLWYPERMTSSHPLLSLTAGKTQDQ